MTDSTQTLVFISPHFPLQMSYFSRALSSEGIRVCGVADVDFSCLPSDLQKTLAWYYRVTSLESYDEVYRAVAFFIHKFGRVSFIESLNEHWLDLEARLRQDFNVRSGWMPAEIEMLRRKSHMKKVFERSGCRVAQGCVPRNAGELEEFVRRVGFPVFAKPDTGVGAQGTFKLCDEAQVREFCKSQSDLMALGAYIVEEFVPGEIVTYDGLTDWNGRVVFASSLSYEATPFAVIQGGNATQRRFAFWTMPFVAQEVAEYGPRAVQGFQLRSRFFHIEFIKHAETGEMYALEANLRPPGSPTPDMWNFGFDFDVYRLYAAVLAQRDWVAKCAPSQGKYFSVFVGRMSHVRYARSPEELARRLGGQLVARYTLPEAYARLMGSDAYIVRARKFQDVPGIIQLVAEERPVVPRGSSQVVAGPSIAACKSPGVHASS